MKNYFTKQQLQRLLTYTNIIYTEGLLEYLEMQECLQRRRNNEFRQQNQGNGIGKGKGDNNDQNNKRTKTYYKKGRAGHDNYQDKTKSWNSKFIDNKYTRQNENRKYSWRDPDTDQINVCA